MLCRRIEERLAGPLPPVPRVPPALESHAERITAQLLARERVGTPAAPACSGRDLQCVDVDSLALVRPRSVGVEHVALWAMDPLGLRTGAALGSVIARLAQPGSERAARRWLGERSALGELLGVEFATMGPMRLYRACDVLRAHREAIEHPLFDRAMGLFDLPPIPLYDLSNPYFEGEARRQPKARRGHSKDKRTDCPLFTLALVLDASGFVHRCEVFAGNVREPHTLAPMLEALNAPPGALVVMDRGLATEERLQWLRAHGSRYLVVSRERPRHFDPEAARRIETASKHGVPLHKALCDDGREVRLYCFCASRAAKERGLVERFARRFEEALSQLCEGRSRPAPTNASARSGSASGGSRRRPAVSPSTTTSHSTRWWSWPARDGRSESSPASSSAQTRLSVTGSARPTSTRAAATTD